MNNHLESTWASTIIWRGRREEHIAGTIYFLLTLRNGGIAIDGARRTSQSKVTCGGSNSLCAWLLEEAC